ncbi:hypothetical protein Tco_0417575 [Tanacetum coccineum]
MVENTVEIAVETDGKRWKSWCRRRRWKKHIKKSGGEDVCFPDVLELQNANACHLKISDITPLAWKNHLDNHLDVELLNLHDHKGEYDMMREREKAKDEECGELRAMCEATMTDFDNNLAVVAMHEKILTLSSEAKKGDDVKRDRIEVVLKVVPYIAMELVLSGELEVVADPSASVEALLSKKPPTLQRPTPSRTQVLMPSSLKATPSSALVSKPMPHPAIVSSVKP